MEIIKFIQSFSNEFLDMFFQSITMFGEQYFYVFAIGIIYWCINKKLGYKLGLVLLGSGVVNGVVKDLVKAPRPIGTPGIRSLRVETATGYSFPSGHTQMTTTFWGFLMTYIKKWWFSILATIFIILVGISRLYLGVHWPKDVFGGMCFGILSIIVFSILFKEVEKRNNPYILLIVVIPSIIALFFFKSEDTVKAISAFLGLYLGYIIEPKYIGFENHRDLKRNILRVVVGLFILILIQFGLKSIFPRTEFFIIVRYFLVGSGATIIVPYLFKKLNI